MPPTRSIYASAMHGVLALALLAGGFACGSDSTGPGDTNTVEIGSEGGVLAANGGAFTLTVQRYALSQPTLLRVHHKSDAPTDARFVPGTAFELSPDDVVFYGASLALRYDAARIPAGTTGGSLQLYVRSGSGWAVIGGSIADTLAKVVTGPIDRGGIYAVRSTPVDHIVLTGSAVGGAVYAGLHAQLRATLYADSYDTLPSNAIVWSSSNQGKATVDATGNVTGVAAGTTTITATRDGKTAQTLVTVLPHPTSDWSHATDWTTYQGDSRHSGYVEATLDPALFHEKWISSPTADYYYPPVVGGGRVYVATTANFTTQKLIALSLSDGSVSWSHDFGSIFAINQPTYDNGTLWITTGGHEDTYIYALDETDGSMRFRTQFESQWEHWKAPIVVGSEIVTAGGYFGGMYGFDRQTGQQTFFMSGPQVDSWAPAAVNGLVYATDYANGAGIRAVNPSDGSIAGDGTDSRLSAVTTPVIGNTNDLFTIMNGQLIKVDLGTEALTWSQSGSYIGTPVVGNGVVYGISSGTVVARAESDGTLLWSWAPPLGHTLQTLALTHNLLVAGTGDLTVAVDLSSHLSVWTYPMGGDFALSSEGMLLLTSGSKVVAIALR